MTRRHAHHLLHVQVGCILSISNWDWHAEAWVTMQRTQQHGRAGALVRGYHMQHSRSFAVDLFKLRQHHALKPGASISGFNNPEAPARRMYTNLLAFLRLLGNRDLVWHQCHQLALILVRESRVNGPDLNLRP